jgi:predicted nucleic acid-binding protein
MKKALIDLNVIIDFLNKREGHEKAAEILSLCSQKKIEAYICAHEITTLAYFLGKSEKNREKRNLIINTLMNTLTVIDVTAAILKTALTSEINDYEDAVIEASALVMKLDLIITRNLDDFKNSAVCAVSPQDFLDR